MTPKAQKEVATSVDTIVSQESAADQRISAAAGAIPQADTSVSVTGKPNAQALLRAAAMYHKLGFNVIPVGANKKPAPTSNGKPMKWTKWQNTSQKQQDLPRLPWKAADGVAVLCGPVSGGVVDVDFDHHPDRQAVDGLLKQLGLPLNYPWVIQTPGGGYRVLVRCLDVPPGKSILDRPGQWGQHVELRFSGRYSIVPPSHGAAGTYKFVSGASPTQPPAVVQYDRLMEAYAAVTVEPAPEKPVEQGRQTQPAQGQGHRSGYAESALQNELKALRSATEGMRNDQLNRSAFALGQLVGGGCLSRAEVEDALTKAALETGLAENEVRATIKSGLEAGIAEPRNVPEPRGRRRHKNRHKKSGAKARPQQPQNDPAPAGDENATAPEVQQADVPPREARNLIPDLAEEILRTDHFARDGGGKLYYYRNGIYVPEGDRQIGRQVKGLLQAWNATNLWSSHRANEVAQFIGVDAPELWPSPPLDVINVLNGLFYVKTGEFMPHSPEHLSPVQLPVVYDPAATAKFWDEFCRSVFPEDAYLAGVHWQILAWLMLPITSLQKALLLLGDGGNGKSRYLAGVTAFLGSKNVTALSLHKLETDRFAPARLLGKLANICPDLASKELEQTAMFKKLTGGDSITAEYKFSDSFEFTPYARQVFSANQPPVSRDSSEGFYRRWSVLPFLHVFTPDEQVSSHELDARLSAPEELSGVLNKALEWLPHVLEHGITETPSMTEALREFRQTTDPLAVWLDRNTITGPKAMVAIAELCDAYNRDAERRGRASMSDKAFSHALTQLRPRVEQKQRTYKGKPKTRVYLGIGFKPEGG